MLSTASVGLSCESSSDATRFSVVDVLDRLKVYTKACVVFFFFSITLYAKGKGCTK